MNHRHLALAALSYRSRCSHTDSEVITFKNHFVPLNRIVIAIATLSRCLLENKPQLIRPRRPALPQAPLTSQRSRFRSFNCRGLFVSGSRFLVASRWLPRRSDQINSIIYRSPYIFRLQNYFYDRSVVGYLLL